MNQIQINAIPAASAALTLNAQLELAAEAFLDMQDRLTHQKPKYKRKLSPAEVKRSSLLSPPANSDCKPPCARNTDSPIVRHLNSALFNLFPTSEKEAQS